MIDVGIPAVYLTFLDEDIIEKIKESSRQEKSNTDQTVNDIYKNLKKYVKLRISEKISSERVEKKLIMNKVLERVMAEKKCSLDEAYEDIAGTLVKFYMAKTLKR